MVWLDGALCGLCLAIGGLHLVRAVRGRGDRLLEAAFAVMALGMAGMFSPVGDPVPGPVWATLFVLTATWFGALLLRERDEGAVGGDALHLVVGSAAMLFMLGAGHQGGMADASSGGHIAHGGGAPGVVGAASAVALVLAAYFVLHTLRCADRVRAVRGGVAVAVNASVTATATATATAVRAPAADPCTTPASALAHLAMTTAMAYMLVGMI